MEGWEGWVVDHSTSWNLQFSVCFFTLENSWKRLLLDDFIAQEPVFFSMATTQQQSPTKLWLNNQNFTKYSFQRQAPPTQLSCKPCPMRPLWARVRMTTPARATINQDAYAWHATKDMWDLAGGAGWASGVAWVRACRGRDPRRVWYKRDRRQLGVVNLCEPCFKQQQV